MRRDREGGHKAERKAGQESGCDQHAVQSVVNAVADDDQHARRRGAAGISAMRLSVVVRMRIAVIMPVSLSAVMPMSIGVIMGVPVCIAVIMSVRMIMAVTMRMPITIPVRVPPQHELLDDEEHTETHQQSDPDRVRAVRPNTLHRLR